MRTNIDVVLLGNCAGRDLFDAISNLKMMRPNLAILVAGPRTDDQTILNAVASGAKGYVFEGAAPSEFTRAIHAVSRGSVWAPRRVLSMFIELASRERKRALYGAKETLTAREKEILTLLVSGLSNKEIGAPLGIVERTVKAHIAKLMHKVGVHNRIELSVHAIAHSLVSLPAN